MKPTRATRRNLYRQHRKLARSFRQPNPEWHTYCIAASPSKKPKPKPIDTTGLKELLT